MKKIIVPVDFSEISANALDFAIEFNTYFQGDIELLHVIQLPKQSYSVAGEVAFENPNGFHEAEALKAVHLRFEEWCRKVTDAGQKVTVRMKYEKPYKHVSEEIVNEKADWIIMGSTGSSGLSEILLGSNAERVIRHADCPVITVKGPTSIADMKSLVLASDLSGEQNLVAQKAKALQSMLDLNIHVVKVRTPHNFLSKGEADKELDAFAKRNHFENTTLNSIEGEYAEEGIMEFAEEVNAGMVVIGTHGKTGLAHFFGGSRAEDLANHSNIPIVTYKLPYS